MSVSRRRSGQQRRRLTRLSETERRRFLAVTGAGAAALILGAGPYTGTAFGKSRFAAYPFTLGVASGDPPPGP